MERKPETEIVTVQQAAKLSGRSHQALYAAIKRGSLKTVPLLVEVQGIAKGELARYTGKAAA